MLLAVMRAPAPYQLDYEEGNVLNATARIVRGADPYPVPVAGSPPYVLSPYGPVFYYLMAVPRLLGSGGFFYPRLLVLLAGVVIAIVLMLLLRHWGCPPVVCLTFGLLFVAIPVVRGRLFLLRVDLVGIAFAMAALYLFVTKKQGLYFSIPLFVAAGFAKYTLAALPMACFFYLLSQGERKKAFYFAGGLGALSAAGLLFMQQVTGGGFWFHMFRTHPDPFTLMHMALMLRPIVQVVAVLMALAMFLVVRDVQQRRFSLPVFCLLLATLTSLTAAKQGSVQNHFLEWLAILCLCAGLSFNELRKSGAPALAVVPFAVALMVLAGLPGFGPAPGVTGCSQAYAYVRNHPGGQVLSENVGAVVVAGKEVVISNPAVYDFLVRWGGWSDADMVARIESRQLDAVLLAQSLDELRARVQDPTAERRWSPAFVDAMLRNYRLSEQFACEDAAFAYEPRAASPAQP